MRCEDLLGGVKRYQNMTSYDEAYWECFPRRDVWENYSSLTEENAKNIVVQFLRKWHVRGKINIPKLCVVWIKLGEDMDALRNFDFSNVELEGGGITDIIKHCFKKLREVLGPTGISKVLHMCNPKLFIMWDKNIRDGYGVSKNEQGYILFMKLMQNELREAFKTDSEGKLKSITQESRKTFTKLVDEYNYAKYK